MDWSDIDLAEIGIEVPEIDIHEPNYKPNISDEEISDDDVDKTDVSPKTTDTKNYIDVICPECAHEFAIER